MARTMESSAACGRMPQRLVLRPLAVILVRKRDPRAPRGHAR